MRYFKVLKGRHCGRSDDNSEQSRGKLGKPIYDRTPGKNNGKITGYNRIFAGLNHVRTPEGAEVIKPQEGFTEADQYIEVDDSVDLVKKFGSYKFVEVSAEEVQAVDRSLVVDEEFAEA